MIVAWGYAPRRPKKPKKYTFQGWQLAGPAHAPATRGSGSSFSRRAGTTIRNSRSKVLGGLTRGSGANGDDPYPDYYDPYGDLLARLAQMREGDIAGLRADLTGREGAIKKLYEGQIPLIEQNYGSAIKEAEAVNNAVANRLGIEGSAGQADLMSRLAMINAPAGSVQAGVGGTGAYYQGLGGANYAMDAGDVQRLIGRSSEEKTYATKQPGIISADLERQYASDLTDLMKDYAEQEFGIRQQQGESKAEYEQRKFEYGQAQKEKAAAAKQDAEDRYWDNYWKKRDEAMKRWEIQQTLGQKAQADKTKKEIAALDNQAKIDIANIRAGATVTSAGIRAGATVESAGIRAGATDKSGDTVGTAGSAKRDRVIKTIKSNILRPDGRIRTWNLDPRIPAQMRQLDNLIISHINASLNAQGVSPNSPLGRNLRAAILRQISGLGVGDPRLAVNKGRTYRAPHS